MDEREPGEPGLEPTDSGPSETTDTMTQADDATGDQLPDGNYSGSDNIREGNVGGLMGPTHQQGGQGQGG